MLKGQRRVPLGTIRGRHRWRRDRSPAFAELVSVVIPCYRPGPLPGRGDRERARPDLPAPRDRRRRRRARATTPRCDRLPLPGRALRPRARTPAWPAPATSASAAATATSSSSSTPTTGSLPDGDRGGPARARARTRSAPRDRHLPPHRVTTASRSTPTSSRRSSEDQYEQLMRDNWAGFPARAIYRRSLFEHVRGFDPELDAAADFGFNLAVARRVPDLQPRGPGRRAPRARPQLERRRRQDADADAGGDAQAAAPPQGRPRAASAPTARACGTGRRYYGDLLAIQARESLARTVAAARRCARRSELARYRPRRAAAALRPRARGRGLSATRGRRDRRRCTRQQAAAAGARPGCGSPGCSACAGSASTSASSSGCVRRGEPTEPRSDRYFEAVVAEFGLRERAGLLGDGGRGAGRDRRGGARGAVAAEAERRLVNISGHLDDEPILAGPRTRVYVDLDPGFTQAWHADPSLSTSRSPGTTTTLTVGLNVGKAGAARSRAAASSGCRPCPRSCSRSGRPTPPPIGSPSLHHRCDLAQPLRAALRSGAGTTGLKHHQFRRPASCPERVPEARLRAGPRHPPRRRGRPRSAARARLAIVDPPPRSPPTPQASATTCGGSGGRVLGRPGASTSKPPPAGSATAPPPTWRAVARRWSRTPGSAGAVRRARGCFAFATPEEAVAGARGSPPSPRAARRRGAGDRRGAARFRSRPGAAPGARSGVGT